MSTGEPVFRNRVGPQFDGWSVLEFYARRYRHSSHARWSEWIREGRITRNGVVAREDDILDTGDVLTFMRPDRQEPPVPRHYVVVFEDHHVLVADKPAALPVAPGGAFFRHTLLHFIREERRTCAIHPAHRLDRETSGLVVFTKSREAARILALAFRERRVKKQYEALLCGTLEHEVTVTAPVGRLEGESRLFSHGVTEAGKEAITKFIPLGQCPGSGPSRVRAVPLTGRMHQVRIHAAHIGHPIIGDSLYGMEPARGAVDNPGIALHSSGIAFPHPDGEKEFRSSPPAWFNEILQRSRR
jgi:23S rRNA pseudouridine1911/1915/1917 synthase